MTIMFCDIRGFTSLSEKLDAESLTQFMNSFLSPMTEIITERKGTIDKYIGDCIMAFWNAPLDDPDHVANAVQAAQARRNKLGELNRLWQAEAAYRVFLPVRIGIGINTGECVVGNFGSLQHFDYSLLGDPVNLASRLEGLGKVYGVDLMIGEETAARLDDPELIELDLVAVKGKSAAGHIYTLPPEQATAGQFITQHAALLGAYRRQDWASALRLLDDGRLAAARFLVPVYDLYRRRIAQFQIEAPPANWNGVFTAEEKRRGSAANSPQGSQHIGADEDDASLAAVEALGVEFRIFADYQILRDMAAAIDDDVIEPSATADLDIGQQHRARRAGMGIDPTIGEQQ